MVTHDTELVDLDFFHHILIEWHMRREPGNKAEIDHLWSRASLPRLTALALAATLVSIAPSMTRCRCLYRSSSIQQLWTLFLPQAHQIYYTCNLHCFFTTVNDGARQGGCITVDPVGKRHCITTRHHLANSRRSESPWHPGSVIPSLQSSCIENTKPEARQCSYRMRTAELAFSEPQWAKDDSGRRFQFETERKTRYSSIKCYEGWSV